MLFEKKEITLKNGEKAILRAPRREDGAEMSEYLRTMSSETEFVIRYPEECTETAESEGEFGFSELAAQVYCFRKNRHYRVRVFIGRYDFCVWI